MGTWQGGWVGLWNGGGPRDGARGENKGGRAQWPVAGHFEGDGGTLNRSDLVGIKRKFSCGQAGVGRWGEANQAAEDIGFKEDFDGMPGGSGLAAAECDGDGFGESVEFARVAGWGFAECREAQNRPAARLPDEALDRLLQAGTGDFSGYEQLTTIDGGRFGWIQGENEWTIRWNVGTRVA